MKKKYLFPLILILLFAFRIILSFGFWHPDLNNHKDWGIKFIEYGAQKFYDPDLEDWSFTWPNQPPGTMYMFAGVRVLSEFVYNNLWQINLKVPIFPSNLIPFFEIKLYPALLKLPSILADFGIFYIIYKLTKKKWMSLIWLINPLIWYNSAVWGQYDSVINFFALLSFYLLINRKLLFAVLAFSLSIYIKASLLIFAPILLIVALRQKYKLKEYLFAIAGSLFIIGVITLPFSQGNPIVWLFELYQKTIFVQQMHVITANAFNLWSGLTGIGEIPDTLPFLGLTYQIWSYILFSIFYIPLLFKVYKAKNLKTVVWALALAAFASFVLLTKMHERYIYPLFPYLTILLITGSIKKWIYWLITLVGLLGMYNFWFRPNIGFIISFLSFGDRLMPRVLGILLLVMFLKLYTRYNEIK